ncbi:MAG: hypothetical protein [Olavius algarvensis Gamma 3 endosymbiont]|nr:MAG: hypothetical protein [Olavius algarvensis Gamma 3 endosymbiont]
MNSDDELHPDDAKRREYLVRLLTIGALTMTPLQQLQAFWGSTPAKLADDKSIFSLEGDVRVNGRRANLETRISGGDVVKTSRDSEVVFAVGSDSFILRSNSEMEIEGGGFFVDTLRMLTGSVLSVFGKRQPNQLLTVNSSTATIGIRSTGVYMESEPGLTYLCTCYGQVGLYSNQDLNDSELITATHHDAPKYITDKKVRNSRIRPAPFKNHTDAELKLLEAIVGREVPFGIESELYKGERREY